MENVLTVYKYLEPKTITWTGTESTSGSFRQTVDWGYLNARNRVGIYLISDPNNDYNIRFFMSARTNMPGGPTGSVRLSEPIIEEIDSDNRSRRLFPVGSGDPIYAEPSAFASPLSQPLKLYVYQVVGIPVKYFGI